MCTAVTYKTKDFYFGRNLDLERTYGECVVITPRKYPFVFRSAGEMKRHYAMIGMAVVADGYPLYFDATNETGLSIAGLNFPGNAVYKPEAVGKDNVAPFELIPWLLGQCANLQDVRLMLERINLLGEPFGEAYPLTPLHWMIADESGCIVVECMKSGLTVRENPIGVLTNNPAFDVQLFNLNNYMHLSPKAPENTFSHALPLETYSLGMGAMGLPGDWSSMSRFVRAAFVRMNSRSGETEAESISQFFHILGSVSQPRGLTKLEDGSCEITQYTSCCNADRGIYYYTTYENRRISAVDMHHEQLDSEALISYPQVSGPQIHWQN